MIRKILGLLLLLTLTLIYCAKDPNAQYKELHLLKYGFPITIMAPDSPEIKTFDLIIKKDLTVKKEDFYVQIFMGDASVYNVTKVKDRLLADQKSNNKYFKQVILDEPSGFIYETSIDSINSSYGFNHIKIQGDKEFVFQTGLVGNFTKAQVERMYAAVKNEK